MMRTRCSKRFLDFTTGNAAWRFLNKNLVERMSKGGIIANVQPQFVPSDLPIIKSRVGEGHLMHSFE